MRPMSALSRHRDGVQLHYGRDDFADSAKLARVLSRERAKDMASDYERDGMALDGGKADRQPQKAPDNAPQPRRSNDLGSLPPSGQSRPAWNRICRQ